VVDLGSVPSRGLSLFREIRTMAWGLFCSRCHMGNKWGLSSFGQNKRNLLPSRFVMGQYLLKRTIVLALVRLFLMLFLDQQCAFRLVDQGPSVMITRPDGVLQVVGHQGRGLAFSVSGRKYQSASSGMFGAQTNAPTSP
jgi:hypothetical protein